MTHHAAPPDPNPTKPKRAPPPGSVDTHFHLFGPAKDFPFIANSPYLTDDALPETLIATHEVLGIDYGVIVAGGSYGRDPSQLLSTLKRFPDRFRGICVPPDDLAEPDIERMNALGVRGVRFVGDSGGRHVAHILPEVAERIADHGWHVQFMAGNADIVDHAERLLALPNDIVLDHFGRPDAALGLDQPAFTTILRLLDTGRVWVKLSGPMYCSKLEFPYPDMQPFAEALVRHAPERLFWGTDWPHLHMFERMMPNDGGLVDLLAEWVPDDRTRETVLRTNPASFYGFPAMR